MAVAELALNLQAQFPKKLQCLFEPHRYKVAYSGRGCAKSWSFARALLLRAAKSRERILCTREIQRSIKDSVHRLLCDQIRNLNLQDFYTITETEIRGANGSEFIFSGLSGHTIESLKSYEGVSVCWVEEGQTVSRRSWDILVPTIREEGSEIWISLNPELDTNETWLRFVVNPPPGSVVIPLSHTDNPWWSEVLEQERAHAFKVLPKEDYENIWEGKCRTSVEGAIYSNEIHDAFVEGRIRPIPYDPSLKVHAVWDFGWNDAMAIILAQKGLAEIRIVGYIEGSYRVLDWYAGLLQSRKLNWGYDWLPHDGETADFKTGKSAREILKSFGRKVAPGNREKPSVPRASVEEGIRSGRMLFRKCYFDDAPVRVLEEGKGGYSGVGRLIECLKRYRRHIPANTNEPSVPVKDEFAHGADAFRYLGLVADKFTNEDVTRIAPIMPPYRPTDSLMGVFG